jgi:hypothetical protein
MPGYLEAMRRLAERTLPAQFSKPESLRFQLFSRHQQFTDLPDDGESSAAEVEYEIRINIKRF